MSNLLELDPAGEQQPITAGQATFDLIPRTVQKDRKKVHLTPKENTVLAELAKHSGRVLTRTSPSRCVGDRSTKHQNQAEYLRVAIRAFRQKLERNASQLAVIVN